VTYLGVELELHDGAGGCIDKLWVVAERAVGVGDFNDLDEDLGWRTRRAERDGRCRCCPGGSGGPHGLARGSCLWDHGHCAGRCVHVV